MFTCAVLSTLISFQPTVPPAPTPAGRPPVVVCIDPGHPSEVGRGSSGPFGTTEVHVVWDVGTRLERLLRQKGFTVVMTKEREEQLVRNRDRAGVANRAAADLMVRLHCDSGSGSGFAFYYPDRQGTTQGVTGPSESVIQRSRQAALAVRRGVSKALEGVLRDGGVRGDSRTLIGSRQGALTGSIFSKVPVITIEMVVLTNPTDARFAGSEEGRARLAQAIAAGIEGHFRAPAGPDEEAPTGAPDPAASPRPDRTGRRSRSPAAAAPGPR